MWSSPSCCSYFLRSQQFVNTRKPCKSKILRICTNFKENWKLLKNSLKGKENYLFTNNNSEQK